jgi:beta-phosphoglucomutase-like phosphatase (HAD superfamily)
MISAVLFDLDGLLADTEKLHLQAYKEVLAAHGIQLRDDEYEEHWSISASSTILPHPEKRRQRRFCRLRSAVPYTRHLPRSPQLGETVSAIKDGLGLVRGSAVESQETAHVAHYYY